MPFNFYDTHTLLMAVQQLIPASTFLRDRYFPTNDASDIFSTEDVLVEYRDGSRRLAPFVAPRKGGVTILRKGYTMERYTPPFVAPRRTLTLDELRKRGFGEALYSQLTPEQRRQMLANLLAMDVARRNRVFFSCVCRMNELSTEAGMEFVEKLSCLTLYLPPVRQRAAQLPAIANIYLSYLNTALAKQIFGLEAEAMTQLQEFDWPHNYTQFQRILQELAQMTHGNYITAQEVQEVLRRERTMATVNKLVEDAGEPLDLNQTLDRINQDIIRRILAQENGNQSRTAARLGISRTTLWRLLNR